MRIAAESCKEKEVLRFRVDSLRQLVCLCRVLGTEPLELPNIPRQFAGFARAQASKGHQRQVSVSQRSWLMARLSPRPSVPVPFGP